MAKGDAVRKEIEAELEALNYVYTVGDLEATYKAVQEVNKQNGQLSHIEKENPAKTYIEVVCRIADLGRLIF